MIDHVGWVPAVDRDFFMLTERHFPLTLYTPSGFEHKRRAGDELAVLRRKLRRLTKRVSALEGRGRADAASMR